MPIVELDVLDEWADEMRGRRSEASTTIKPSL